MKKYFCFWRLFCQTLQAQERPKLVVGIVVDQMKMEYLYRFFDDFSHGFKRLIERLYPSKICILIICPPIRDRHASIYTGTTRNTWNRR
jgi:hypothetical protein